MRSSWGGGARKGELQKKGRGRTVDRVQDDRTDPGVPSLVPQQRVRSGDLAPALPARAAQRHAPARGGGGGGSPAAAHARTHDSNPRGCSALRCISRAASRRAAAVSAHVRGSTASLQKPSAASRARTAASQRRKHPSMRSISSPACDRALHIDSIAWGTACEAGGVHPELTESPRSQWHQDGIWWQHRTDHTSTVPCGSPSADGEAGQGRAGQARLVQRR